MIFKNVFILSIAFGISGCSAVVYKTTNIPDAYARQYYLPKGKVSLKAERKSDGGLIEVTLTPSYVPDYSNALYLHKGHSVWYEDKYVVEVDKNGLLKAVNSTNNFQGDDIVKKFGELAGKAIQLAAKPLPGMPQCSTKPFVVNVEIDPYENLKGNSIPEDLCLNISYTPLKKGSASTALGAKTYDSILYRKTTEFNISVSSGNSVNSFSLSLPDLDSPIEQISINRGSFVDRDVKLTFADGVLTKDETTYPSEILGFLSLPLELVNGISQALTGRLDLKTTELQKEKAYLDALNAANASSQKGSGK